MDRALMLALADAIGVLTFRCGDVFVRMRQTGNAGLRDALREADVENPKGLGWWCRRMVGHDLDGFRLLRLDDTRAGLSWRIMRVL